ncbi:MAG: alpha/beta hydrolase [Actinomycetes bacterium]
MDLYAPQGAKGLPLVVFFHGKPLDKSAYGPAAEAIARQGAVVAVPNWGVSVSPAGLRAAGATTPKIAEAWRQQLDGGACAVDYAVTHAKDFGADPSRLVLAGNSAGANEASVVGLGEKAAFPGCLASATAWKAKGLMLWEGDWILADTGYGWDTFQGKLPRLMAVTTPWQMLDDAKGLPVVFGVTDTSRQSMRRCAATETFDWLVWRDPSGELRRTLTDLGAYQDGCIDTGEGGALMASAMNEKGLNATLLDFTDPGSSHMFLGERDLDLMAQRTVALASR